MNLQVKLEGNEAAERLMRELGETLAGRRLWEAVGAAGGERVREHFYERDGQPNKMGAKKTHFWRAAEFGDLFLLKRAKGKRYGFLARVGGDAGAAQNDGGIGERASDAMRGMGVEVDGSSDELDVIRIGLSRKPRKCKT